MDEFVRIKNEKPIIKNTLDQILSAAANTVFVEYHNIIIIIIIFFFLITFFFLFKIIYNREAYFRNQNLQISKKKSATRFTRPSG